MFDSNVWIAFYMKTDLFHYEAIRLMGNYSKRKYQILIPLVVLVELITVLTKKGVDINRTKTIVSYIQSTNKHLIYSIEKEELPELALQHACQIKLKSLDYIIFLHYVKLNPAYFESFDTKLLKSINKFKNNHEKK